MKVHLNITLKKSISDHKAKLVETSINREISKSAPISNMAIGKYVSFDIDEKNKANIESIISKICDELLIDPISEQYEYKIDET